MSSRADRTNCKFNIQYWKFENEKAVNAAKLTKKKNSWFCKKALKQIYTQFFYCL